jgi:cell cycle sensor histidine kinase DivJ
MMLMRADERQDPKRDRAMFRQRHFALSAAAALATAPIALACGADWSLVLPASFVSFASCLIGCAGFTMLHPKPVQQPMSRPAIPTERSASEHFFLEGLDGLVSRHDPSGQILSATGAGCASFGLAGSVAPSAFLDCIHVSGRLSWLQAIDSLRQGANRSEATFRMSLPGRDGILTPVRCRLAAERDGDGNLTGFLAHTLDLTEQQALDEEVRHWMLEARSANDAKTRFLAAVSHELRTPLNAILGFSDILIGEYFGKFENERQKEYVELINQSGNHLLAVVNTMLDMSKIEAGRYELIKEHFSIASAIHTVDEMLGLQARKKNVTLAARVARGLDEVVGDRRAIQQVLINLVNNAIKFTEAGGVVTVDAKIEGRNLVLSVSDTGIGIAPEKLVHIGKPFMQVQNDYTRQYEGTGLGLALVKGLVGLHGGTFRIESEEGKGTVITVTVPSDGEAEEDAESFDFPPRLTNEPISSSPTGEDRHGTAEAKIA